MSEAWGADHIPSAGRVNLVEALSVAQHLPAEAIEEAVRRPRAVAEPVLRVVDRAAAGEALSQRERNLLFWGIHVLGAVRDERLCGPLLRLLRQPLERTGELIGETVGTTLHRVLAGTFDGDLSALEAALFDRDVDEHLRWSMFAALSFLTFSGQVPRDRAATILVRFDAERAARAGDAAWTGWEETIALLGFDDLRPRVEAARAEARLLDNGDPGWFETVLTEARLNPGDPERFAAQGLGYIEDAVGELEDGLASDEPEEAPEPLHNPLRDVGRNDPCPCGSGRKFKKCCLGREAA